MNTRRMLSILLTFAVAAPVFAQRIGEAVQVTVVEVPVTVVDREGKSVAGLTAENFELYDEGKRVPIEYFDVLDLSSSGTANADAAGAAVCPCAATGKRGCSWVGAWAASGIVSAARASASFPATCLTGC